MNPAVERGRFARHRGTTPLAILATIIAAASADAQTADSLVQAANDAVTLAEFHPVNAERDSLFVRAVRDARMAVTLAPDDARTQFTLARALGHFALTRGLRERAHLANEIRDAALATLAIDSTHDGALHVMGLWHQKIMELSGVERLIARTLLGAKSLNQASWDSAQANLEAAVRIAPNSIAHRLDLGRFYAKRKQWQKAREQLEWVMTAPALDPNDENYRKEGAEALDRIKP